MAANIIVIAFGETKTSKEWINDGRCLVKPDTLYRRVKELGWSAERAMTETVQQKRRIEEFDFKAGHLFGHLVFTGSERTIDYRKCAECRCNCGSVRFYKFSSLISGNTKSCGCKRSELISEALRTHGLTRRSGGKKHPLYSIWTGMRYRCYSETNVSFKNYGLKGITVCDGWKSNFGAFYEWAISNGWQQGLTLDRRKNEFGYSPENCRWITIGMQQRNKRNTVRVEAFGETKSIPDWIEDERCSLTYREFYKAVVRRKINPEKAIMAKTWQELISAV